MTTDAQLAANHLNAMKHGLVSRESLVKGESEAELVDRIVSTAWRLRRLVSGETMLFDKEQAGGRRPGTAGHGWRGVHPARGEAVGRA